MSVSFRKERKRKKQEDKQKRLQEQGKKGKLSRQASTSSSTINSAEEINLTNQPAVSEQHKPPSSFMIDQILQVPSFNKALYLSLWRPPAAHTYIQPMGFLVEQQQQNNHSKAVSGSRGSTSAATSTTRTVSSNAVRNDSVSSEELVAEEGP